MDERLKRDMKASREAVKEHIPDTLNPLGVGLLVGCAIQAVTDNKDALRRCREKLARKQSEGKA